MSNVCYVFINVILWGIGVIYWPMAWEGAQLELRASYFIFILEIPIPGKTVFILGQFDLLFFVEISYSDYPNISDMRVHTLQKEVPTNFN